MITQDRIDLNKRFVEVFELLVKDGEIVKNDRNGKGVGDVAEKILGKKGYGHIIRAYLNETDKRVISYHQARLFCSEFGVNEAYLIDGIGKPFGFEFPKHANHPDVLGNQNIMFTTVEAFAGTTIGAEALEEKYMFSIPGLKGDKLFSFPIKGNSMEPVIMDGDIIICRQIENIQEIEDSGMYAIKHDGTLVVKYVQKIMENGAITKLKLISANHFEYDPYEIEVNYSTQLLKVIRRISSLS